MDHNLKESKSTCQNRVSFTGALQNLIPTDSGEPDNLPECSPPSRKSRRGSRNQSCEARSKSRSRGGRKRTLSTTSRAGSQKRRKTEKIREKRFEKERKKLEKRIERRYSNASKDCRKSKDAKSKTKEETPGKSSDEKRKEEKDFKEEYNKRLDYLERYGKNFYCPSLKERSGLRPIYIDGSNVAFSHGQNEHFSVEGLKICIDYFRQRGHEVKAFVPHFRLRKGESSNQQLLHKLMTRKLVITTPTLYIQNKRRSPYDDWYIIQSAAANGGIIVSSDNFQDIIKWNPNLRGVIEERRLVPTFVDDMLIFPVDPHGNRQNNLEQFLKF